MDKDTQVTFAVIGVLILFLAGLAYFLRESITVPLEQVIGQATTTKIKIPSGTKPTAASSTTSSTTLQATSTTPSTTMEIPEKITSAVITTNKGVIEVTFATSTPIAVEKFAKLAVSGFYNGTKFHRVIRDFMIQGGDPLSKDDSKKNVWGTGGPGYTFKDEFGANDVFSQGVLAMANAGPGTNGSQFFIVTAAAGTPWLVGKHTIFGHVTKGLDVALRIQDVQVDGSARPLQDVVVEKIEIK
jgi:cyclophilin family peptidyl-prolyl cis-trans isomerase